jgi:hypothetical protein
VWSIEYDFLCNETSVPLARGAHTPSLGLPVTGAVFINPCTLSQQERHGLGLSIGP